MLSAINNNKETILSFELDDLEIEKIRKNKIFFKCSCCQEEVILKHGKKILNSGNKKITHFAHKKDSACPIQKESEEHIRCKISIFKSLKKENIEVYLEKTINLNKKIEKLEEYKKIVQDNYSNLKINDTFFGSLLKREICRPDVLFKYNKEENGKIENKYVAIEIQKTILPTEDFLLRTLFYNLLGINVLWVVPEKIFLKKCKETESGELSINLPDFYKELKKYYFGKIYCWNEKNNILTSYKFEDIIREKSYGNWQNGEYGGDYWSEEGTYNYTYKKFKYVKKVNSQIGVFKGFKCQNVSKNEKFKIRINAKVWID